MLSLITAALVCAGPASCVVEPRIVSASLFKNGYAVVVREIELKAPEVIINHIPKGSLGTYWISASEGVNLKEIVRSGDQQTKLTKASTITDILALNIGESVIIELISNREYIPPSVSGQLVSVKGDVVVLESNGKTIVVLKKNITGFSSITNKMKLQAKDERVKLIIRSNAPKGGKAYIVSLVNGATWVPAFRVDLQSDNKLKMTAKATIMNDIDDLADASIRLITGYPNIRYVEVNDPMTSSFDVSGFVDELNKASRSPESRDRSNPGSNNGGFGPPRSIEISTFIQGSSLSGQVGDMFFYPLNQVNLMKGDRGYYTLFTKECPYDHLYTWGYSSGADDEQSSLGDVWHCLKIKNETGFAWTTSAFTTFKDGEMIGQDTLRFTMPGAEALVRVTKALDIQVDTRTEELERETGAVKDKEGNPTHDRVTQKRTFTVRNLKTETIKFLARENVKGAIIDISLKPTEGPTSLSLDSQNPESQLDWLIELKPGETKTWTCTSKVLVKLEPSSRSGYRN